MLTDNSDQNLIREEIDKSKIFIPGNSIGDALLENREIAGGTFVVI